MGLWFLEEDTAARPGARRERLLCAGNVFTPKERAEKKVWSTCICLEQTRDPKLSGLTDLKETRAIQIPKTFPPSVLDAFKNHTHKHNTLFVDSDMSRSHSHQFGPKTNNQPVWGKGRVNLTKTPHLQFRWLSAQEPCGTHPRTPSHIRTPVTPRRAPAPLRVWRAKSNKTHGLGWGQGQEPMFTGFGCHSASGSGRFTPSPSNAQIP